MRKLLAVLTLVAAACSGEADFSGMIDTVILSAEEYQFEILAVDRLLFTETPLGEAGIKDLSERLEKLAVRVKGTSDSKFLALESLELRRLAKRVGRLSPAKSGEPLRNDWMRIRNNLFDDRAWFVRSPADLEYAAQHEKTLQPEPAPLVLEIPPPTPATPVDSYDLTRFTLTGKWRVTNIYGNGVERSDPEMTSSTWNFNPPRLAIVELNGRKTEYTFTPVRDAAGDALRIQTDRDPGWMNYRLEDGVLTIAFHDNLRGGRPAGFEPVPGEQNPLLVLLKLRPLSE